MAKDSWLTVNPMAGEGNATLTNSGTIHKGRLERQTVVTAVVKGIEAAKSYQVKQEPTAEYITLDQTSFDVGEGASTITVSGKSNSPKITFSLGTGNDIPIVLPANYTANGLLTVNGTSIPDDPGAVDEFVFSMQIPIPKNTVGKRTGKVSVTGSTSSVTGTVTITQATSTWTVTYSKGDYINTINKTSEKINWGGTATAVATLLANTAQYTYSFTGWYEGDTKISSDLSLSVSNITANRTFTAIGARTLNRYTLSFTITPTGAGTVSGGGTYDYGSSVKSTATPATGYNFTKWVDETGGESTTNPYPGWEITKNRTIQAVFTIKSYSITLAAQFRIAETGDFTGGTTGGTVSGGGTVTHGTSVTAKATPATGYSFAGWYEGSNKVSDSASYTFSATGNRSLTARFQRQWFTVTFTAGTGGSVAPTSARVEYGGEASSTATAATGYTFSGWSNGVKTAKLTVTNVTANATYAASFGINTYVITYAKETGIASVTPTSETVEHGANAVGSTAALTTGYNFDGWYNGATRVSTALKYGPTNVTSNMTLTAKATIKTFAITGTAQYRDTDSTGSFTTGNNGGSVTGSGTYNYGSKATLTAAAAAGYTFQGWYDAGGTQVSTAASYVIDSVTAAVTVYARFQKNWFTVTYTRGTGVNALTKTTERVAYNGTVTSETAVASTGYNTPTWTKTSGTGTLTVTAGKATLSRVQSNCTLTASATINKYTVSYTKNANIASISKTSETVNYGGTATCTATLPANTAQYTYSFGGWYEGSTQIGTALALSVANITAARTFEARGVATVNKYTLTVVNGSGSGTYNYGTKVTITASAIEGKTFSKWSDGVTTASREVTVTANATYTAEYTTNTYTVTYVKGTGIAKISKTSETVSWGANATGCTATVTTGYTFDGWYNGPTRVSTSLTYAPTAVKSNLSLTAKANINSYTVSPSAYYRTTDGTGNYTAGTTGGTVSGGGSVNHGGSITVTASAAAGYKFDGWYSAGASGGTLLSSSASYAISGVTASMTVYARFTRIYYTITYSAGDYVASLSRTTERVAHGANAAGSTMTVNGTTAQYSYGVDGWYSGSTRVTSSATYAPTGVTANATYTAKGTRSLRSYTVTYNKGSYISSVSRASESVSYGSNAAGSTATVMASNAQYTYGFDGWYNGSTRVSTSVTYAPTNITGAVTLEARGVATVNKYTLTVVNGSGSGTYNYGTKVTITASAIEGKTFSKWSDGVTTASREVTVTANATYTAEYTTNTYTVTYVKGTGIAKISKTSETVSWGANATGCTATVTTGYTFDGWYNGPTRVSTSLTYAPTAVKSNLSLTAKANINSYTVSPSAYYRTTDGTGNYTAGTTGGTVSGGGSVNHGGSITVTASAAAGYKFDGWYSAGASGGTLLSSSASYAISGVTASMTVYARFTRIYYTITYSAGDYVASLSRTTERVAHGANAAGSTMTVNGTTAQYSYGVDGWYSGSTRVTSSATYAPTGVTANATYTAKGTRSLRSYTVTYNKGSYISSVSRASESVSYGSNAAGSTATVMASNAQYTYGFDGWYNGSTRVSTSVTYAPTNITGAVTLEARGTRTTKSYTISVSLDSSAAGRGSVSGGGSYAYGASATVKCTKTNSQDVFDGWYEGSTRVSTSLSYTFTVTGARTLVAKILYLDVTPTSLSYGATGGSQTFKITTNTTWKIS